MDAAQFDPAGARRRLFGWYRQHARDLPWRRTRDPYRIWVSEIMLQQTRVAAAIPYYERFLARFSDVGALARARLDSVLALWSGLGYYRRARHLHAAARVVARDGFPSTAAGWRELPGVGPYTAAAIASIAFGEPVAVVDGNVERVISRLHAIRRDPARVRALAREWCSRRKPGGFNQALMELGATVCTPHAPRCDACPVKRCCAGRAAPHRYPAPKARPPVVEERRTVALALRDGRVCLVKREGERLLEGLWELPRGDAAGGGPPLAVVRHFVLNRRILLEVRRGDAPAAGRWYTRRRLASLPLTAAARKCLRSVGFL